MLINVGGDYRRTSLPVSRSCAWSVLQAGLDETLVSGPPGRSGRSRRRPGDRYGAQYCLMELCSNVQSQTLVFWNVTGVPARSTVLPTMCAGHAIHRALLPPSIVLLWIEAGPCVWIATLFCENVLLAIVALVPPYGYGYTLPL